MDYRDALNFQSQFPSHCLIGAHFAQKRALSSLEWEFIADDNNNVVEMCVC